MKNLLRLVSLSEDPTHATAEWRSQAIGTIFCPMCHNIKNSVYPKSIDLILEDIPDNSIHDPIWWVGISIFHIGLIEQIVPYFLDYVLGKCFDSDGNLVNDYVTCYSKDYIVVRGVEGSKYKICPECGVVDSIPGLAPHYIPRFYLTESRVYMDSSYDMYLDEDLALGLDLSRWKEYEFDTIPIRDDVLDGQHLPIDPPLSE